MDVNEFKMRMREEDTLYNYLLPGFVKWSHRRLMTV